MQVVPTSSATAGADVAASAVHVKLVPKRSRGSCTVNVTNTNVRFPPFSGTHSYSSLVGSYGSAGGTDSGVSWRFQTPAVALGCVQGRHSGELRLTLLVVKYPGAI